MIKRIISVLVATFLLSTSISITYAAEPQVKQNKLLSLAYIMTFTDPDGSQHYAIINGEQTKVKVEGGTTKEIKGI